MGFWTKTIGVAIVAAIVAIFFLTPAVHSEPAKKCYTWEQGMHDLKGRAVVALLSEEDTKTLADHYKWNVGHEGRMGLVVVNPEATISVFFDAEGCQIWAQVISTPSVDDAWEILGHVVEFEIVDNTRKVGA